VSAEACGLNNDTRASHPYSICCDESAEQRARSRNVKRCANSRRRYQCRQDDAIYEGQRGHVRVLINSTEKMGASTDVQRRLKALMIWMLTGGPATSTSAKAAFSRQGNLSPEINVYR
jgi:hypothetical protein